jgi:HPt (histidine-containing phosphotransfer) domain-containing protein
METEYGKTLQELAKTLSLDIGIVKRLVVKLVESKMDYLTPLEDGIRLSRYPEIAKNAHALKGVCLELRLKTLSDLAYAMEAGANEKAEIDYSSLINRIRDNFISLERELAGNG